ncbi:kinase-like domain-containing protein, partial [Gigaspora rosea]
IMVLQLAKNGNLEQYLEDNFLKLQWVDKLRIAKEIALGLVFLHKHDIIHRDLHIKNILVHEDRMLIADFGLSIYDTENFIDYGIYGMPAFIDPQALKESSYKFSKKSDIYGLGVIYWEISSGHRPFKTMTDFEVIFIVQQGNRETPIKNTPLRFVKLYELCWDENPEIRPEANTIREELDLCISDGVV